MDTYKKQFVVCSTEPHKSNTSYGNWGVPYTFMAVYNRAPFKENGRYEVLHHAVEFFFRKAQAVAFINNPKI